ncbi:MAG: hypothetical protein Q8Q39_03590 [bacterium]|nr:hypothetical protein [bacterium]
MTNGSEIIDVRLCRVGQINDLWIGGGNSTHCRIFSGNAGYYTQVCDIPRRLGEVQIGGISGQYCRDLAIPPYLHILTSPSFPIAVFATIILYFFLRYIMRLAESPKVDFKEELYKPPSKKDLRFPPTHAA